MYSRSAIIVPSSNRSEKHQGQSSHAVNATQQIQNQNSSQNNRSNSAQVKRRAGLQSQTNHKKRYQYNHNSPNYATLILQQSSFNQGQNQNQTAVKTKSHIENKKESSLVMSESKIASPAAISINTVESTTPNTPASYTSEFLRYVGVQVTADHSIVSSVPQTLLNTSGQHTYNQLNGLNYNNINESKISEPTKKYDENQSSVQVSVMTNGNVNNAGNHASHNTLGNYHSNQSNRPQNRQNSNYNYHYYQQQTQHPPPSYHQNNNYHMHNRNHHHHHHYHHHHNHKKNWNWNQSHHYKKNQQQMSHNINGLNKFNGSNENIEMNQNRKNLQNNRHISCVPTSLDASQTNSRSPTPSPKSESPPIGRVPLQLPVLVSSLETKQMMASTLSIESQSTHNISTNGYESDSSLSSYRTNGGDYIYEILSPGYAHPEVSANATLVQHHQNGISNSNDDPNRAGFCNYNYGLLQNFAIWNSNLSPTYLHPDTFLSNGTDAVYIPILDLPNNPKRRYSGQTSPNNNNNNKNQRNNRKGHGTANYHFNNRSFNYENSYTPPDRFLARSHLIETKEVPEKLIVGTKWDKLSQMVWDKFISAQQTEVTYKKKMNLWKTLYLYIKKTYPRYGLYLVGSTISGFGADTSDVDMCLVSRNITNIEPRIEAVVNLTELRNFLMHTTKTFEQFHLIQAKVPILRFKDSSNLIEVDLNFNNCVGIRNTHLLYCYSKMDWRLRPLALVVKLWAQYHHINNAKNMTISSYSLVLMVIHFLQCAVSPPVLPCLHAMYPEKFQEIRDINTVDMNEQLEPYHSDNKQTLGELFLQFLEYYSNFDYLQYAISVRTASVLPIEECRLVRTMKNDPHQWKQLCIEEPFDLTNTARSVYDGEIFEKIKYIFWSSWKILDRTMDLKSVFSSIVIPSATPSSLSPTPSS